MCLSDCSSLLAVGDVCSACSVTEIQTFSFISKDFLSETFILLNDLFLFISFSLELEMCQQSRSHCRTIEGLIKHLLLTRFINPNIKTFSWLYFEGDLSIVYPLIYNERKEQNNKETFDLSVSSLAASLIFKKYFKKRIPHTDILPTSYLRDP